MSPANDAQELKTVQRMLGLTAEKGKVNLVDPVFICIDCEAFEHAQNKITEIGLAVLDTRDITGIEPGLAGQGWIDKIQYTHYRPVQYAHLRNKNFIKGAAEGFNFGSTTWINLVDARDILVRIFRYPSQLLQAANLSTALSGAARNVVFVAHGSSNDTAYLRQVGFDLKADAGVGLTVDTQRLAGGSKKRPVGLHRLLLSLGVNPVNLHNAGNDSAYTLQSMVRMALNDVAFPGSVAADLQKHQGKLPPLKYSPTVAPHVWAGTAVQPDAGLANSMHKVESTSKVAASAQDKIGRKERKRAARVAGRMVGSAVSTSQKSLPSIPGHTITR